MALRGMGVEKMEGAGGGREGRGVKRSDARRWGGREVGQRRYKLPKVKKAGLCDVGLQEAAGPRMRCAAYARDKRPTYSGMP